jgi:hypothetical protein
MHFIVFFDDAEYFIVFDSGKFKIAQRGQPKEIILSSINSQRITPVSTKNLLSFGF